MARWRAEQRSIVAKVRVYELAKEFGVESKAVMAELEKMGEFVRSASSTIEAPVVRRLKEAFAGGDSAKPGRQGQRVAAASAAPSASRRDQGTGDDRRDDRGTDRVPGGTAVAQVGPAASPVAREGGGSEAGSAGVPSVPA